MSSLRTRFSLILRQLLFRTPLRRLFLYRHNLALGVWALGNLAELINQTRDVEGVIAEFGVDRGVTTVLLNNHMDREGIEKPYLCLDTFGGFVEDDVAHEVDQRGRRGSFESFSINDIRWFRETMALNGIERVTAVQSDVKKFAFEPGDKVSFALLDMDIYQPTVAALRMVYDVLSPGGIIAVDDCHHTNHRFDGAHFAYQEFMKELGQEPEYLARRLGIVRKPAPAADS